MAANHLEQAIFLEHRLRFNPNLFGPAKSLHYLQRIHITNTWIPLIEAALHAKRYPTAARLQQEMDRRLSAGTHGNTVQPVTPKKRRSNVSLRRDRVRGGCNG